MRLPAGTEALDVDFTALSYREPERVTFRHRLDGVDADWREGGDRSARYTNLGPGRYRFRVLAANDDGVWNTARATFAFDIAPSVTQTAWFRILCIAAAALAAWRLQLFWIRRTARRLAVRLGERIAERERIARALDVTLQYTPSTLVVTIADDGIGLPSDVDAERGRAAHWGIPGMRERARTLGAALTVDVAPGAGTTWTLRVPAAIAFAWPSVRPVPARSRSYGRAPWCLRRSRQWQMPPHRQPPVADVAASLTPGRSTGAGRPPRPAAGRGRGRRAPAPPCRASSS